MFKNFILIFMCLVCLSLIGCKKTEVANTPQLAQKVERDTVLSIVNDSIVIGNAPITYLEGDVTLDGKVNISDISYLMTALERRVYSIEQLNQMDVNKDGKINQQDADSIKVLVIGN